MSVRVTLPHPRLVVAVIVGAAAFSFQAGATSAKQESQSCSVGTTSCVEINDYASTAGGGGAAFFQNYPKPYCTNPDFPKKVSNSMQYYLMSTGRQYPVSPSGEEIWTGLGDMQLPDLSLDAGEIHTHVRWHTHCEGTNDKGEAVMHKAIEFWMPLVTSSAIIYQFDLIAEVVALLPPPVVEFSDADAEHGWLYVNVDHHIGVQDPGTQKAERIVSNPTGKAHARVEGIPLEVKLELPAESGVEGLAECDLKTATTTGCPIKFSHSSSIADGGTFTGTATLYWGVASNSGKYNGFGPFTTQSEFSIQVAEAMAVGSR